MQVEEGLPFCKICLEIDTVNNFISPCLCTSFVHKECLDTWRLRFRDEHPNRKKCMDCRGNYDYQINPEVSYHHRFISYCYTIAVVSVLESAACEFGTSMLIEDIDNEICYYLMLPNTLLCVVNLVYSIWLGNNPTSKKLSVVFVCIFNTVFISLLIYIFGSATFVVQPMIIFVESLFAIKNVKAYVLENKIEGWQILVEDA